MSLDAYKRKAIILRGQEGGSSPLHPIIPHKKEKRCKQAGTRFPLTIAVFMPPMRGAPLSPGRGGPSGRGLGGRPLRFGIFTGGAGRGAVGMAGGGAIETGVALPPTTAIDRPTRGLNGRLANCAPMRPGAEKAASEPAGRDMPGGKGPPGRPKPGGSCAPGGRGFPPGRVGRGTFGRPGRPGRPRFIPADKGGTVRGGADIDDNSCGVPV